MVGSSGFKSKNLFTYSEAMLISGASKQISSAIFIFYSIFYNLLKIWILGSDYKHLILIT